jgi:hypothetical protein
MTVAIKGSSSIVIHVRRTSIIHRDWVRMVNVGLDLRFVSPASLTRSWLMDTPRTDVVCFFSAVDGFAVVETML